MDGRGFKRERQGTRDSSGRWRVDWEDTTEEDVVEVEMGEEV